MSVVPRGWSFRAVWFLWALFNSSLSSVLGLNLEGFLLLAFKNAVLNDPLAVLGDWNSADQTPCGWNGVTCAQLPSSNETSVISLALNQSQLVGSLPAELGRLQHLRHLDLSNNQMNGSIPFQLFRATEMTKLLLANNAITGSLHEGIQDLKQLQYLDLSSNALTGTIPRNITKLSNMKVISLKNNYFSGSVPRGFGSLCSLEVIDLSWNLLNGSIPPDLGNITSLHCALNLSGNRLSGTIPPDLGKLPANTSIDVSNNNLTGPIPQNGALKFQKPESFLGNPGLCGFPLKKTCTIASTLSNPPKNTSSPSAIAAIPMMEKRRSLSHGTIAAIVVGDFAGIVLVCGVFMYRYWSARSAKAPTEGPNSMASQPDENADYSSSSGRVGWFCLKKAEETSEGSNSENGDQKQEGTLVTLAGDVGLELDKLLRASAYILGATGYTILYKAVLEDGLTFAVRRLGEGALERFKDFEKEISAIGRIKHPNVVLLRGYYWSMEEKLLIYDYIPNGSLAHAYYGRSSNSPFYLPWAARIKIAKGVARGLAFLHERKHVHGNIKPSNILLGFDMEPHIADFGLDKLLDTSKCSGSAIYLRNFEGGHSGSKVSTGSREIIQTTPDMITSPGASKNFVSPYQAPEALKTLKPNQKWDVYSFGIVFMEMLTGKPYSSEKEILASSHSIFNEKDWILKAVEPSLRPEVEGKEEVSVCLRMALSCASSSPQKRPTMKEILHTLEKIPSQSQLAASTESSTMHLPL